MPAKKTTEKVILAILKDKELDAIFDKVELGKLSATASKKLEKAAHDRIMVVLEANGVAKNSDLAKQVKALPLSAMVGFLRILNDDPHVGT